MNSSTPKSVQGTGVVSQASARSMVRMYSIDLKRAGAKARLEMFVERKARRECSRSEARWEKEIRSSDGRGVGTS